jgi:hypothetical protein
VRPILPAHTLRVHEPQVRLVDQSRRLEAVLPSFTPHAPPRDAMQLGLDEGHKPFERTAVASSPCHQ